LLSVEDLDSNQDEHGKDVEGNNDFLKLQSKSDSSLTTYFKYINRYGLLNEDEEKRLAISIKEREVRLKNLLIKFNRFLKKDLIEILPSRHEKDILKRIHKASSAFQIFDEIIELEKTRKKINRGKNQLINDATSGNEFDNKLSTIETSISKKIGQINLSENAVKRVLYSVRKLADNSNNTQFKKVEWQLANKLREIKRVLLEIRSLKNELVKGNLRLVITIARKYLNHGIPLVDLIQEGNLGLIRAIDTYDYRMGNRFITYAVWWIRQAVLRMIDCHARTIRIPVYMREKMNKIDKVSVRLFSEANREPTCEEIAEATETSPDDVKKIKQSFTDTQPFDELSDNNREVIFNSSESVNNNGVFEHVLLSDLKSKIDNLLSMLTTREKEIVKLRFGVDKKRDYTLEEIGKKMGLSRERIRQILDKVLKEMNNPEDMRLLNDYIEVN
jgi:RNA polymerase primary sigma factor